MSSSIQNLVHLNIPLEDILEATNHFSDENFIIHGGFGKIYKGTLLRSGEMIDIVARRLDGKYGQGSQQFWTEVSMLSRLKHEYLVSLVGFCDEKNEKIVINKYEAKGSLDHYVTDLTLRWTKRLEICVKIAHALSYIRYDVGRDFSVIHRNIKTSKILLDDNYEPKLAGFNLSMTTLASRRGRLCIVDPSGTAGYVDPTYVKTGTVTHESDIYSFGVVLFEVLFGKKAIIDNIDIKLAEEAKSHYEEKQLDELIDPDLRKQMDQESFRIFAETAYYCLKEQRSERPHIDQIVVRLDKALNLQREQENLESAHRFRQSVESSSDRWKVNENILSSSLQEFAHLQIPLEDIASATCNFADENFIGHGGFGKLYRGKLLRSGKLIDIVTQRLDGIISGQGVVEFSMEISMLSNLKHENLVSLLGFCDENGEKIIIYEHAVHGSLDQYLSDPTLTWSKRLQMCIGVARALDHIHYDVIHCDINSSKVLIDKDWEAKVYGFGLSTKYPESWSHRLFFSQYFEASGCTDAVMTPKYDVYSFGLILLEILCGRKLITRELYVEKKLDVLISPNQREQIESQTLTMFSDIAYKCLNQHMQRPTMDQILKELGEVLELHESKHKDLEPPAHASEGTSSSRLKEESNGCLKIRLSDIMHATNKFDQARCIGRGGYGEVYKADLEYLGIQGSSTMEEIPSDNTPKRRSTVAIKRIFNKEGQNKEDFFKEVDMLNSCKHQNIISLLGICTEDPEMILICEFASNGSLEDCLEKSKMTNVTWAQRLRICLDIAEGLKYLHTELPGKSRIFHRDVKSANVLLDKEWNAKVSDFGLSKFNPKNQFNQHASTIIFTKIAGTIVYLDPEYMTTGKYKKESDIYSFGIVLFEILSGRLAYDQVYTMGNGKGLATVARRRFNEGTLKELIDPNMLKDDNEHIFTLNKGPNQDSFDAFSKIAYQCLAETQVKRPTMEAIIKELRNAINFQGKTLVLIRFRLSDIVNATNKFSHKYCIGVGTHSKMYNAELEHFDSKSFSDIEGTNEGPLPKRRINVSLKRISNEHEHGKQGFFAEIEMLTRCKHPNIASLLGISCEDREMILVYEDAFDRSLNDCLGNTSIKANLSWVQRIQISLDIAQGLSYLLTRMEEKQLIMHFEMCSANILLKDDWKAQIACLWHSTLYTANQEANILKTNISRPTQVHIDPEIKKTGKLIKESAIYSFGIILVEILSGRLETDELYNVGNEKGLPYIARRHFDLGTLNKIIDPYMMKEANEDIFLSNRGPNQDSLAAFSKIACQCLAESPANRPTTQVIIMELQKALNLQENNKDNLQMSFEEIKLATKSFSHENLIGRGRSGRVYRGEITRGNERITIAAKRFDRSPYRSELIFLVELELEVLIEHKHENIICLEGYCREKDETIIVYEHASNRRLDRHLKDASLTWVKRLEICIGIAKGLAFLHGGESTKEIVLHRDITTSNILLNGDWMAKISGFGSSVITERNQTSISIPVGTVGYIDPEYESTGFYTEKSDIYSLGVVLFEVLYGRLLIPDTKSYDRRHVTMILEQIHDEKKLDLVVFPGIMGQIAPESLFTFQKIVSQCLDNNRNTRPTAEEVLRQLTSALKLQEDCDIWEPKLPRDYKQIIRISEMPGIYFSKMKKDIYEIFCKGILLQKGKVLFWLRSNGERNEMISARTFSYIDRSPHKWRSVSESRFLKVAEMLDISNLMIKIKTRSQFLSGDVVYGVHLVFKFCDSKKCPRKPMYVNLKYRNECETSHAYFATRRDSEWMIIELFQFLNQNEGTVFNFLLESFSRYYCGDGGIYVEGIEFRAIDKESLNVKHEEIKELQEVKQVLKIVHVNVDQEQNEGEKLFFLSEVNGKKHLMLSPRAAMHNFSDSKHFTFKSSSESRFQEVIQLLPQQVFRINCKIKSQMLTHDTEYLCYLVFKLSDKCRGLHCPVKVRDLLHRRNKEAEIIYFRSPSPWNIHDITRVPQKREDGWMEVNVWQFNSKNQLKNECIRVNLKLISYEGTMSGLIVCGLEFRPI